MSEQHAEREQRVTPLELFFDLVFVFGFTEVTTALSNNPNWSGLGHALLVLVALWWAWARISTTELGHHGAAEAAEIDRPTVRALSAFYDSVGSASIAGSAELEATGPTLSARSCASISSRDGGTAPVRVQVIAEAATA